MKQSLSPHLLDHLLVETIEPLPHHETQRRGVLRQLLVQHYVQGFNGHPAAQGVASES